MTCSQCHAAFCGWCLKDCGNDAHEHVKNCSANRTGGYHSPIAAFHAVSLAQFRKGATAYLRSLDHALAKDVVEYASEVMHNIGLDDVVKAFGGAVFREGQGGPAANARIRARKNFMHAEGM